MSHTIVEQAFNGFSEIGKIAVVIELKLRLLSKKFPEIQSSAHAIKISETESALLPLLLENEFITIDEQKHLEQSRKIRNKIFHCEFETAVKLIEELSEKPIQQLLLLLV